MAKIICLVADLFDEKELFYPALRLKEAGFDVEFAGKAKDVVYKSKHGLEQKSDWAYEEVDEKDFAGLLIPGGYAPDRIRTHEEALKVVRNFHKAEKPIGMICHAGWVGISAEVVKGRTLTATPAIRWDMENAGVHWVDEAPTVDAHLVSARSPEDLPEYVKAYLNVLKKS